MRPIEQIKPLMIIRNPTIRLSKEKENPIKGTLIVDLTKDLKVEEFRTSNVFQMLIFKSLYVPKKSASALLAKKWPRPFDQLKFYKDHMKMGFSYFKLKVENYDERNLYYPPIMEINKFLEKWTTYGKLDKIKLFKTLLNELTDNPEFKAYKERYIFIVHRKTENIINDVMKKENISNIPIFLQMLFSLGNLNAKDFKGYIFILYNNTNNTFFKFTVNDIITNNPVYLAKLKAINSNAEVEETVEEPEEGTPGKPSNILGKTTSPSDNVENIKDKIKKRVETFLGIDKIKANNFNLEVLFGLKNTVDEIISTEIDGIPEDDIDENELIAKISNNVGYKKYLNDIDNLSKRAELQTSGKSPMKDFSAEGSRDSYFDKIKMPKIKDLQSLPVTNFNKKINVPVLSDDLKSIKSVNKSYIESNLMELDKFDIFRSFEFSENFPIESIKVHEEDTSTLLDKKITTDLTFKTTDNKIHKLKLDIPKVLENEFLVINGNKKKIIKQLVKLPVTKVKNSEVELVTNYNKFILERYGQNVSPKLSRFSKLLVEYDNFKTDPEIKVTRGNSYKDNKDFKKPIELLELMKDFISIKTGPYNFIFSEKILKSIIEKDEDLTEQYLEVLQDENLVPIGYYKKGLIVCNRLTDQIVWQSKNESENLADNIVDSIVEKMDVHAKNNVKEAFYGFSIPSKYIYSRLRIVNNWIPLIVALGFYNGLTNILDQYGVKYEFTEKRKNINNEGSKNLDVIKFKDGYLYYESNPYRYSLLMNGLKGFSTSEFAFEEMNGKMPYALYMEQSLGSINITKGIENILSLMIDPITISILKDLGLPTDISRVLLYMNTLLENNLHRDLSDISNYRVRGAEIVNAYLYKVIADAVKEYRDKKKSGMKDIKLQITKNKLIRTLSESTSVEDYSILNPIVEAESLGTISAKGLGGINLTEAYTKNLRAFNESMQGLIALNHPESAKAGVIKYMTTSPKIINARGMVDLTRKNSEISTVETLSPAELLSPFTSQSSDPSKFFGLYTSNSISKLP